MTSYSITDAAKLLGMTTSGVRYRIKTGKLNGRETAKGWRVYMNGDEPAAERREDHDPLIDIADELIGLGRRLKKAVKEHDAAIRRDTIVEFATTLAEEAKRGR